MKKFIFLIVAAIICSMAFGQRNANNKSNINNNFIFKSEIQTQKGAKAATLVMNWMPVSEAEEGEPGYVSLYGWSGSTHPWGYVCGTNSWGDMAKVEKFTFTESGTINSVYAAVHYTQNNNSSVKLKIYGNNGGFPGTELYTQIVLFSSLDSGFDNVISLSTPFSFTSGTYFVGFEFEQDYTSASGRFGLFCQDNDVSTINTAYERWNDETWHDMSIEWEDNYNLFIGLNVVYEGQEAPSADLVAFFLDSFEEEVMPISTITIGNTEDLTLYPYIFNLGPNTTDGIANLQLKINGQLKINSDMDFSGTQSLDEEDGIPIAFTGGVLISYTPTELDDLGATTDSEFEVQFTVTYENDPNPSNNTATLIVTRGNTAPVVIEKLSVYPEGTSEPLTTEIYVTFDGAGSGTVSGITVTPTTGTPMSTSGSFSGSKLTIANPGLVYSTEYTVLVPATSISNYEGSDITWTFTTMDHPATTLSSTTPSDNAFGVALNAVVSATFNQIVSSTNSFAGITINGNPTTATASGSVLTIAHDEFDYNTLYEVIIPESAIEYYTGGEIKWSFTTKGEDEISWLSTTPANLEGDVELNATVSVTFDDDVTGSFAGITINGSPATATASGSVLTIAHADFEYETTYEVIIPASAIEYYTGGDITWSFTTKDEPTTPIIPIEMTATFPTGSDVAINTSIYVTFSGNGSGTVAGITITPASGTAETVIGTFEDNKLSIPNTTGLAYNTTYTVFVPAENIDNYEGEDITWSFTTAPDVSVKEYTNDISIYPNPSKGEVNISVKENSNVRVIDVTGRVIENFNINANAQRTINQAAGMYFINIESNGQNTVHKVIINK